MPTHPPFNRDAIAELEDENVILQALLSCATGVWFSDDDDSDEPEVVREDALIIQDGGPR